MSQPGLSSTLPAVERDKSRWEIALRYATIGLIGLLVAATAAGLLGVRTVDTTVSGRGYEMTVTHAGMTRPGLATPFSIRVRTTDGAALPSELTLRVSSDYLAMFDDNGMEPIPVMSFNTAEWTLWTFAVPDGHDSITVALDARLEPAVQWGRSGEAGLEVQGETLLALDFTTGVSP